MAVTYLTKTELGHFLQHNGNIEASVRSALFDSLEHSGVFQDDGEGGTRGWFEYGPFHGGAVPPTIQILDVSKSTSVETNPNLKAIMTSAPATRSGGASGIVAAARLLGQASGAALVALCFHLAAGGGPELALWIGSAFALAASIASFLRLLPERRGAAA